MKNYFPTIKRLQNALNSRGRHVTISTKQFYSESQQCLVNIYSICEKVKVEDSEGRPKKRVVELFSSSSQVYILLFLRDLWYEINDYEIPNENKGYVDSLNNYKKKNGADNVE